MQIDLGHKLALSLSTRLGQSMDQCINIPLHSMCLQSYLAPKALFKAYNYPTKFILHPIQGLKSHITLIITQTVSNNENFPFFPFPTSTCPVQCFLCLFHSEIIIADQGMYRTSTFYLKIGHLCCLIHLDFGPIV